jgi:hypothetical protein
MERKRNTTAYKKRNKTREIAQEKKNLFFCLNEKKYIKKKKISYGRTKQVF